VNKETHSRGHRKQKNRTKTFIGRKEQRKYMGYSDLRDYLLLGVLSEGSWANI